MPLMTPANWMSFLVNEDLISTLTIPGSHDSWAFQNSSWYPDAFVLTQDIDVAAQFEAGIRFFDMRLSLVNGVLQCYHGGAALGNTFNSAISPLVTALELNSNEFIVISIKNEGSSGTSDFFNAVETALSGSDVGSWYLGDSIPTVSNVRGKFILFRRFSLPSPQTYGIPALGWPDDSSGTINLSNGSLIIQDQYTVDKYAIPEKVAAITTMISEAINDQTQSNWYINFCSGVKPPWTAPIDVSNGWLLTVSGSFITEFVSGVNSQLSDWLPLNIPISSYQRCGTLLFDYTGAVSSEYAMTEIFDFLIQTNFNGIPILPTLAIIQTSVENGQLNGFTITPRDTRYLNNWLPAQLVIVSVAGYSTLCSGPAAIYVPGLGDSVFIFYKVYLEEGSGYAALAYCYNNNNFNEIGLNQDVICKATTSNSEIQSAPAVASSGQTIFCFWIGDPNEFEDNGRLSLGIGTSSDGTPQALQWNTTILPYGGYNIPSPSAVCFQGSVFLSYINGRNGSGWLSASLLQLDENGNVLYQVSFPSYCRFGAPIMYVSEGSFFAFYVGVDNKVYQINVWITNGVAPTFGPVQFVNLMTNKNLTVTANEEGIFAFSSFPDFEALFYIIRPEGKWPSIGVSDLPCISGGPLAMQAISISVEVMGPYPKANSNFSLQISTNPLILMFNSAGTLAIEWKPADNNSFSYFNDALNGPTDLVVGNNSFVVKAGSTLVVTSGSGTSIIIWTFTSESTSVGDAFDVPEYTCRISQDKYDQFFSAPGWFNYYWFPGDSSTQAWAGNSDGSLTLGGGYGGGGSNLSNPSPFVSVPTIDTTTSWLYWTFTPSSSQF